MFLITLVSEHQVIIQQNHSITGVLFTLSIFYLASNIKAKINNNAIHNLNTSLKKIKNPQQKNSQQISSNS